jgi:hypothetical protein
MGELFSDVEHTLQVDAGRGTEPDEDYRYVTVGE